MIQRFGNTIYGPIGGIIYTLIVSISALGSLNSNIFLTGRVVVSASRRGYFPRFLGGHLDETMRENEARYIKQRIRFLPVRVASVFMWVAKVTSTLRWEKQVPMYVFQTCRP